MVNNLFGMGKAGGGVQSPRPAKHKQKTRIVPSRLHFLQNIKFVLRGMSYGKRKVTNEAKTLSGELL